MCYDSTLHLLLTRLQVPFAYRTYHDYVMGKGFDTKEESVAFMKNFKATFCRREVLIHFLGLFDAVNSVGCVPHSLGRGSSC